MENFQLLQWDTEILEVPTAKILPERLTAAELAGILQQLKTRKIDLVFWAADSADTATTQAAQEFAGFLADRKLTYAMKVDPQPTFSAEEIDSINSYKEKMSVPELYHLAFEIAQYSRFGTDPRITKDQMQRVYKTWMDNSVNRQIAKEVLVIEKQGKVVGVTTLGEKNSRADIGLLAVDPDYRGRQLGSLLVKASQKWSKEQSYPWLQVVTQQDNQGACSLYEKCGFKKDKLEHFYHFWL